MNNLTLPYDSQIRKQIPITSGVLNYFPAAISGVARVSYFGNEKHNPGQPLHHARVKSTDHSDCIARHLMDTHDLLAVLDRCKDGTSNHQEARMQLLSEVSSLAWRALALSQELHERYGNAPLAPGAK